LENSLSLYYQLINLKNIKMNIMQKIINQAFMDQIDDSFNDFLVKQYNKAKISLVEKESIKFSLGNKIEMNHVNLLSEYMEIINLIKENGFNPIAVSQMYFEHVYVFETSEMALEAFNLLEVKNNQVSGWWYGLTDFVEAVALYEEENNNSVKVNVHWLVNKA
jgi:hypothetical protein